MSSLISWVAEFEAKACYHGKLWFYPTLVVIPDVLIRDSIHVTPKDLDPTVDPILLQLYIATPCYYRIFSASSLPWTNFITSYNYILILNTLGWWFYNMKCRNDNKGAGNKVKLSNIVSIYLSSLFRSTAGRRPLHNFSILLTIILFYHLVQILCII